MKKLKSYALGNYTSIPQSEKLTSEQKHAIDVVAQVLPFKANNYVVDELINWEDLENDPIFQLTFPQKGMLLDHHFNRVEAILKQTTDKKAIMEVVNEIRYELNPNPAGQKTNVPQIDGIELTGAQHKYRETLLFFPSSGQTCHAYCTFCFRWPQFVGIDELKFAMKETDLLLSYLEKHQEVTDLLFTGGDPMIMSFKVFNSYITPFLNDQKTNIQTIRIGTKSLAYWPYKFITDPDADNFLRLFEQIINKGINLSFMAHFSHPHELETEAVKIAIQRLRAVGVQIRTQSPILRHINDDAATWASMWRKQVNLNCIPYYMFVPRNTGAQHYFSLPLVEIWEIYQKAYQQVSGICRTVRGPSMSCTPGKIQLLGVNEINDEKIFLFRFLQGKNPDWVCKPFYAKYNKDALWLDDLEPLNENEFFFETDLQEEVY